MLIILFIFDSASEKWFLYCFIENKVGDVLVQASKRNLILLHKKGRQHSE